MDHPLEFLSGETPGELIEPVATPEPEPAAVAPETPTPPEGPARAPDGKFAPKAKDDAQPAAADHVPLSSMLDERDKRKAAEARAKALEQRIAAQTPQTPAEPTEQIIAQRYSDNLRFSRRFAEREYGKDTIAAVHDWAAKRCDEDPHFNQQMRSSDDPYEAAYRAYNRDRIAAEVNPETLAEFKAWKAAQAGVQAQTAQTPQPDAPPPPRSLVNAPGNGAAGAPHVPVGEGEAFRAAIPR